MPESLRRLEAAFEQVARTSMAGLAFVNPRLRVEAVGFREWRGERLGVLVTPWSINLVLLPGAGEWPPLAHGAQRFVDLPAGTFRFIAGAVEGFGDYHACSLFSPALEFADQAAARATAAAAIVALLDSATPLPDAPRPGLSRRDFLRGGRAQASPHAD